MNTKPLPIREVIKNLDAKYLVTIILSIVITVAGISYVGHMLYRATQAELELRGEMDVIQSSDRFNSYLIVDKNALMAAGNAVNRMLISGASADEILEYITAQTESLSDTLAKSFTGIYGWIKNEYLDGAGWVPDDDFAPTERPWYTAAAGHPHEIVFVDPYVDKQTGSVMMTIAELLDDGESVIALDIGMEGIQEITEGIAADTQGSMVMVLDNGNIAIAHSDAGEIGNDYSGDEDSLGGVIVYQLENNDRDHFTVNYSDQTYMVFTKQIEGGWRSVSVIETDYFYRPLISVILLTLVLGIIAIVLLLSNFYSLSQQEISNRNLGVQIRAAADIYDNLLDIDLTKDSFYEIKNRKNPETIGTKHLKAQETLNERIEKWLEEGMRPYLREFLDLSTLEQRLAGRDTLTAEFLDIENIWYRGRIICAERKTDGTVTRVLWGTESIDDEKKQREHLQHLAETDLMTGVQNRISGEYSITQLLNSGKGGMFVLFDIDHFKWFNDCYGHTVGDQVIISVANCLKNAFRGDDVVLRLGGDEFAAFAVGVYSREVGEKILARFYDYLNNIVLEKSVKEKIYVSAGAVFGREEQTLSFSQLYETADKLMYASKKTAGNQITFGEC